MTINMFTINLYQIITLNVYLNNDEKLQRMY